MAEPGLISAQLGKTELTCREQHEPLGLKYTAGQRGSQA